MLGHAHTVHSIARQLDARGDLDAAIAAIDRADSLGVAIDPTLYRDRHRQMAEDREVLVALRNMARLGDRNGTAAS